MMSTFDYPASVLRPLDALPTLYEAPLDGFNLERLGLIDTDALVDTHSHRDNGIVGGKREIRRFL
jgi:hypothetical protein